MTTRNKITELTFRPVERPAVDNPILSAPGQNAVAVETQTVEEFLDDSNVVVGSGKTHRTSADLTDEQLGMTVRDFLASFGVATS